MANKLIILILIVLFLPFVLGNCEEGQIEINTASLEDLDKIIWVGSVTAQNIVDARPYTSLDDLTRASGIGDIKLQDIKEQNLACVGDLEETVEEDEETPEEKLEPEVIKIVEDKASEEKEVVKEEIKVNPKAINTENDTSKLIKGEYALIGLAFFSMLIIFLLVLKLKPKDKNEFD